jgi:DNA-binding transcriptional LysR family regulator
VELRQLRYLDAVARRRSFTRAARDLDVAQSALSQQVGRLERELEVELLRRTTRRVEVTEAGELVLARARRVLAEVDGVHADLDALRGLTRGRLRIGGVPPAGPVHPAEIVAGFARAHPGVAITVRTDVAVPLLRMLRDGDLDLVMAYVDPDSHEDLDGVRLREEELVVVAAPDHPLARAKRVRAEHLSGEALVNFGEGSALRETLAALVPGSRVVAEANDLETMRELTARGLGVAVMPRASVAAYADSLLIRSLEPRRVMPFGMVWRAGERPTPASQAFREHVLAVVSASDSAAG